MNLNKYLNKLIILGTISSLMFLFYYHMTKPIAEYEDKDMTREFFNSKAKYLAEYKINYIDARSGEYTPKRKSRVWNYKSTITKDYYYNNTITFDFDGEKIEYENTYLCSNRDFLIDVKEKSLKFNEEDIKQAGKQIMYELAVKCVDNLISDMLIQIEEYKRVLEKQKTLSLINKEKKIREEKRLNEKFTLPKED